jgi:hypothetical protein
VITTNQRRKKVLDITYLSAIEKNGAIIQNIIRGHSSTLTAPQFLYYADEHNHKSLKVMIGTSTGTLSIPERAGHRLEARLIVRRENHP